MTSFFGKVPMNRGEVVEVDWPFTDLTGSKPRPAVLVQADYLNLRQDSGHTLRHSWDGGSDRPGGGILIRSLKVCYSSCKDLLTRDESLVLRTVGVLSDGAMRQIEDCLKQVLGIP